jgi:hypothetical protein
VSYLGQKHAATLNAKPRLRIRETVVAVRAAKARIARFLSGFVPAEERLESKVYADGDILKDLRVYFSKRGVRFLDSGEATLLRVQARALARSLINVSPLGKQGVVQTATFPKRLDHLPLLGGGREEPIAKGFTDDENVAQSEDWCTEIHPVCFSHGMNLRFLVRTGMPEISLKSRL